jgi:hypothetical protein
VRRRSGRSRFQLDDPRLCYRLAQPRHRAQAARNRPGANLTGTANLSVELGLIHPIVVDKDGFLIDGRNRARACEIAGIEPTTVLFEGDDPRAYIIASNIARSAHERSMATEIAIRTASPPTPSARS